jgi:hypothetical protein
MTAAPVLAVCRSHWASGPAVELGHLRPVPRQLLLERLSLAGSATDLVVLAVLPGLRVLSLSDKTLTGTFPQCVHAPVLKCSTYCGTTCCHSRHCRRRPTPLRVGKGRRDEIWGYLIFCYFYIWLGLKCQLCVRLYVFATT